MNTLQRTITTAEHERLLCVKDRQVERLSKEVIRLQGELDSKRTQIVALKENNLSMRNGYLEINKRLAQMRIERDMWQKKASEVPY